MSGIYFPKFSEMVHHLVEKETKTQESQTDPDEKTKRHEEKENVSIEIQTETSEVKKNVVSQGTQTTFWEKRFEPISPTCKFFNFDHISFIQNMKQN